MLLTGGGEAARLLLKVPPPPELLQRDGSFHYLASLQQRRQLSVLKEQQFPGLGGPGSVSDDVPRQENKPHICVGGRSASGFHKPD